MLIIYALEFLIGFTWGLGILALLKYLYKKPINIYKDIPVRQEIPTKPKHNKPIAETDEQRRQRILNENIENYDGSPKGQIKL
jgi:hypothetical protein